MKKTSRAFCTVLATAVLLAGVVKAKVKYFPSDFPPNWYAPFLAAMHEPSLWEISHSDKTESYRFLWLRSFHSQVAIRVDIKSNGTSQLTTRMISIKDGDKPGKLTLDKKQTLTVEKTSEFLEKIEGFQYWKLPSVREEGGADGARWIIEATKNGDYHIVDKWSPEDGEIRALGLYMLKNLANLEIPEKEIY